MNTLFNNRDLHPYFRIIDVDYLNFLTIQGSSIIARSGFLYASAVTCPGAVWDRFFTLQIESCFDLIRNFYFTRFVTA